MLKQLLNGFVRLHILYHASQSEIYGVEMIEELKRHGYRTGPGTVYPILHQMEKEGYLQSERRNVNGKMRIYYRITQLGLDVMAKSKTKLRELVKEVLGQEWQS